MRKAKLLPMSVSTQTATVFGGTGFIGTQVVRELAKRGLRVKVATRVPERAYFLRPCGTVGQVVPFACDYDEPASIAAAVHGSDVVVNCIGMLCERKKGDFQNAHTDIPAIIAQECAKANVKRFVHISIPNIEADHSQYATTKLAGEKAIADAFPSATILRSSLVFGPDDDFFNKFAKLMKFMPMLPLIGGGKTKFQPVYVGDVAQAAMVALFYCPDAPGRTYELGGPETVTFQQVYELIMRYTGYKRKFVTLPWGIAKMQAFFMGMMPSPLLTQDQVESLKSDFTANPAHYGFKDLRIQPTAMDMILPTYLSRHRAGGRFAAYNAA